MSNEWPDVPALLAEARECAPGDDATELAVIAHRLADALEAAARVPVQGEPNDDREALEEALDSIHLSDWDEAQELCVKNLADAVLAAGFSRASVPDAVTEELEAQLTNAKAGWESALRIVNEGNEIIKQVGAERDAATATIERVRVILNRDDFGDDWEHDEWVYRQASDKQLADIEAALDSGIDTSTAPKDYRPNCKCSAALDEAPEPERGGAK